MRPVIAITMGDPAGIGPEIAVKALSDNAVYEYCKPVVIGDAVVIEFISKLLRSDLKINIISNVKDALFEYGAIDVLDLHFYRDEPVYGKVSAEAGHAAFESVIRAIDLALQKKVDATVTAPINKESIHLAGINFAGHTEIYAHYTKTGRYAMLLVHDNLRVIHVSTHVSLRQACDLVKQERILEVIKLLYDACLRFGIGNPRIAVAGLNPHSSDNGLFGWEEEREIIPAINKARQSGYNIDGPVPADTMFSKALGGMYDGCVAMYHDQGHIPFKVVGFRWDEEKAKMDVKGVNITLGLPIIRVSVDHGTAFEIAGRGIASEEAMLRSIEYAAKMSKTSEQ